MAFEDFARIPKDKARRYKNAATGETISRWEYEKRKTGIDMREKARIRKAQGVISKTTHEQNRLNGFIHSYKAKRAKALGVKPKDIKVRGQSDEAVYFRDLHRQLKKLNKAEKADKSPTGKMAKILEALGLRDPEWQYPVGQSPT